MLVVPLAAGLPCDARDKVASGNSLRRLCLLRSNNPDESDDEARCRAPSLPLCFSAPTRRPAGCRPSPFSAPLVARQGCRIVVRHRAGPWQQWSRVIGSQHAATAGPSHATSGVTRADAVPGGAPCWRRRRAGKVRFALCCKQGDGEHVRVPEGRELRSHLSWTSTDRDRGQSQTGPLPHHPACGSAPGGSRS